MSEHENIEAEIAGWCASYIDAFNKNDAALISEHWHFPALVLHGGQSFVFKTADHFTKNTNKLLAFYQRQGVEAVRRKLYSYMVISDGVVSMVVDDVMLGTADEVIVSWRSAYILRRNDAGWRACSAVADGEAKAWENRGTPMGS